MNKTETSAKQIEFKLVRMPSGVRVDTIVSDELVASHYGEKGCDTILLASNAVKAHAAPRLYEALKELMNSIGGGQKQCGHDFTCKCAWEQSKAALAKAENG